MKKLTALLLALLMVFAFAACTNDEPANNEGNNEPNTENNGNNEENNTSDEVNEITVIWQAEPNTLDPVFSGQMYGDNIFELVFDRMVGYKESETGAPVLTDWGLSKSWENVDELTWRFYLYDNVKFQDGEPLTTEDVVYTFERTVDPELGAAGNYQYAYPALFLDEMVVIDDYTIEFKTSQPVVLFPDWMKEFFIFPKHYYEANEVDFLSINPMGSGPYKMTEYKLNELLVLERDDNYWNDQYRGYLDKITFRFAAEAATRVAELVTGNADIIDKVELTQKTAVEDGGMNFVEIASGTREYIGLVQYNNKHLTVKELRQAINYAVDWDTIANTLMGGYSVGNRLRSFAPTQIQDEDIHQYTYDVAKAQELMASVGYKDNDGDGFVEDANGNAFELTIAVNATNVMRKDYTQAVAQYMSEAGIKTNVDLVDWNTFTVDLQAKNISQELYVIGSGPAFEISGDATDLYYASSANYVNWINDEYTELYEELGTCFDTERRAEIGHRLQEIAAEEAPWIFLYSPALYYGVSNRVEWTPMANGRTFLREAKVVGYEY